MNDNKKHIYIQYPVLQKSECSRTNFLHVSSIKNEIFRYFFASRKELHKLYFLNLFFSFSLTSAFHKQPNVRNVRISHFKWIFNKNIWSKEGIFKSFFKGHHNEALEAGWWWGFPSPRGHRPASSSPPGHHQAALPPAPRPDIRLSAPPRPGPSQSQPELMKFIFCYVAFFLSNRCFLQVCGSGSGLYLVQSGQEGKSDPKPKVGKKCTSSCFEVLDGLFWELKASSVTWTYFVEAQG